MTQLIWGGREWLGPRTKGKGEMVRHVRGAVRGHQVSARDPEMRQVSGRTGGGTKWGDNGSIIKGTRDTSDFVG